MGSLMVLLGIKKNADPMVAMGSESTSQWSHKYTVNEREKR
ncbi:hypothetical protein DAD186_05970 [Dermabacter vaginalis]|uniref:Uncharacterized protein n=1 Tax=Dermabacter vaginalis TaxID=1630135 RepID=A0A1B0ZGX0_9MICO|nr:hypothetical protein DAD186_05970 [Dermabacter vaginalis]